jgi:hypothetical protein
LLFAWLCSWLSMTLWRWMIGADAWDVACEDVCPPRFFTSLCSEILKSHLLLI